MASTKPDLSALVIHRSEEAFAPKPRRRWLGAAVAGACLVAAGAALYVFYDRLFPPKVEVITVRSMSASETNELFTASGYLVAQRQAGLGTRLSGRVEAVLVKEGDFLEEGQIYARLESADLRAQLAEERALLEQARRDAERLRALLGGGFVSESEVERAASQVEVHEARTEFLESQLALTELRAPFAGLVLHKDIEVGETVASISPVGTTATPRGLITLADRATLEGEVDVTEAQLPNLREGQPAEIRLDARPGEVYSGRLRQIVPTADRQKATVLVKVQFDEIPAGALPEMSVRVTFLHEEAAPSSGASEPAAPSIPRSALFQSADGATAVWKVKDERAVQQRVRTGEPEGGRIQDPDEVIVLEGLQNNDAVVIAGGGHLREGLRVRVKNASRP